MSGVHPRARRSRPFCEAHERSGSSDHDVREHRPSRQPGSIDDRTFEVAFDAPGVEAYAFTFG
jgi:hypothetical protein